MARVGSYHLFLLVMGLAGICLIVFGQLSVRASDDASGGADGAPVTGDHLDMLNARVKGRWRQLRARLSSLKERKRQLEEEREQEAREQETQEREAAAAAAQTTQHGRKKKQRLVWNSSVRAWLYDYDEESDVEAQINAAWTIKNTRAFAARRAEPVVLPSPPPPLGPAVLLRSGLEAGCLYYMEPLELLARAPCDFDAVEELFVWEPRSRQLQLKSDTRQCVDYFVNLQDWGVWDCFDAGNEEFVYDRSADRFCLFLDRDKCLQSVAAEDVEAVQLRIPGDASCLGFDDPHKPLSRATCDTTQAAQRWRFEPQYSSFRAVMQPSLCLDYQIADQAFSVWGCDRQREEEANGVAAVGDHAFIFHRYSDKYCLRRGSGSICVQVASRGSSILLRRPAGSGHCLSHAGSERRISTVECDASEDLQRWVYHSATATFRAATDENVCLDFFHDTMDGDAEAAQQQQQQQRAGAGAGGGAGGGMARMAMTAEQEAEERWRRQLDGGGVLGSWPCRPLAPNERFAYDRFMGRYCVTSRPHVCVMEAMVGTRLRLREPGGEHCLHFDGGIQDLMRRDCNATEPGQQWAYDAATLVFRAVTNARRCIDFFVAHATWGIWTCRDELEVNSQQQFRYFEESDRFCLLADPHKCLQEATSNLIY